MVIARPVIERRWAATVLIAAALTGIVLRVAYLGGKPFWRDEAWVARVVELPPAERATILHVCPPGFLATVRTVAALLPALSPEVAYRILPLAAGVASMALLPLLARRLGAPQSAALCT